MTEQPAPISAPANRPPTITEVAKRAGAGVASVSRVLSGHPDVSDTMRQRVLEAVAELGYEPNMLAQGLRRHETSTVGFVLSNISNPLLAKIVQGAEGKLREAGYSMLLTDAQGDSAEGVKHLRVLRQRRVDGLLVITSDEKDPDTVTALSSMDQPLVVIDRELPATVNAGYVLSDHQMGMTAALDHLLSLGHTSIGLIAGSTERPSRVRQDTLRAVLDARDLQQAPIILQGPLAPEYGTVAMEKMLTMDDPPTAVILGGSLLLEGALPVLHRRGIEMGTDLSLISCDDTPLAQLHRPSISVITRDAHAVGAHAAEMLLTHLRGSGDRETLMLPTQYIPRESVGRVPVNGHRRLHD